MSERGYEHGQRYREGGGGAWPLARVRDYVYLVRECQV
jgi:hypothetical protein